MKTKTVREFDKIICSDSIDNEDGYVCIEDEKAFAALERLSQSFRRLSSTFDEFLGNNYAALNMDDDYSDNMRFCSIGRDNSHDKYIQIRNYVGVIKLTPNFQLEILPKINLNKTGSTDDTEKEKEIFAKMLQSMYTFNFNVFDSARFSSTEIQLLEIFITIYLELVKKIVRRGLKSDYIGNEDNQKYYKGKLLVGKHIRYNAAHEERFYIYYDEYSLNRPENRLIKTALIALKHISKLQYNRNLINGLLAAFEGVEESFNYKADFKSINLDRMTKKQYQSVLKWTEIFLDYKSFSPYSGAHESVSLLFNMHDLFEAYVYQQFRKQSVDLPWSVVKQGAGEKTYLFEKVEENGEDLINRFLLKPDILVKQQDGKCLAVLDTKWKRLNYNNEKYSRGITREDMYQMFAYSQKFGVNKIWLVYPRQPIAFWPRNDEGEPYTSVYHSDVNGEIVDVGISFVDMENPENSLSTIIHEIEAIFPSIGPIE